jgi:hypothetical protein
MIVLCYNESCIAHAFKAVERVVVGACNQDGEFIQINNYGKCDSYIPKNKRKRKTARRS